MTKTENEGLSFWKENEPRVRKLRLKYLDRETVIEAMKLYHQEEVQKNLRDRKRKHKVNSKGQSEKKGNQQQ